MMIQTLAPQAVVCTHTSAEQSPGLTVEQHDFDRSASYYRANKHDCNA